MTRDDVVRLARQAGMQGMLTDVVTTLDELQRFAALVARQEREQCAKVCDEAMGRIFPFSDEVVQKIGRNVCATLASAIRARGAK